MKKTLLVCCSTAFIILVGTSSIKVKNSISHTSGSQVSGNSTGCTGCHGGAGAGGSMKIVGLPSTYAASTAYPITIHISNGTKTANNWGYVMKVGAGKFSTTNTTYVTVNAAKTLLYHTTAPNKTDTAYDVTGITWTSPATGNASFTFAGIAGNGDGSSGGDKSYKGTLAVTLPIKLVSFSAQVEGIKSKISWVTASEANVNHFELERSLDAKNFVSVGKINPQTNNNSSKSYTFSDFSELLNGTIYYRLKSIDNDGSFSYSDIRTVVFKSTKKYEVSVYPNPVQRGEDVHVNILSSIAGNASLSIVNALGQRVMLNNTSVKEGSNSLIVNSAKLSAGMYYLVVSVSNTEVIQKIPFIVR
jgi:hypothetical protein